MDEPEHLSSGVEAVEATVNDLVARVALLAQDLAEVAHDLDAIVGLLSRQNGEPFRSLAAEIIGKRQVTRPPVTEERR